MEFVNNDDARSVGTDDGLGVDGRSTPDIFASDSEGEHTDVSDEDDGYSSDEDDLQKGRVRADLECVEEQDHLKEQERLNNLRVSVVINPLHPQLGTVSATQLLLKKYYAIRRRV